jgi:hypothetical protein
MARSIAASTPAPDHAQVHHLIGAPRPVHPRASARAMLRLHPLLESNRLWRRAAGLLEAHPALHRGFTWAEQLTKGRLFGCRMCGQCALPSTAYTCPRTCPKQLSNGPCGGVSSEGQCEVYPELHRVWVVAYERAEQAGRTADLRRPRRPIGQRKWGQSSWVNYRRGRDDHLWRASGMSS